MAKKKQIQSELSTINLKVAGIDIGNTAHYAMVSASLTANNIRKFETFSRDLEDLAQWLLDLGIESVAMESTGIYWQNLYDVLESKGFELLLVNARYPKQVSGRKTDVSDSAWIQQLHSYGLLPGSFIPSESTRELRHYVRQRNSLAKQKGQALQRMGKSLQQMNVKLQNVVSKLETDIGMRVVRAIAEGETNPKVLAEFYLERLKASKEDFEKSLEGNFKSVYIFSLKQSLATYDFLQAQMQECEQEIEKILHQWQTGEVIESEHFKSQKKKRRVRQNDYHFEEKEYLQEVLGTDVLAIPGISGKVALDILSETGTDMSPWKSAEHFTSWLGLAPKNKISGDRLLGHFKSKHKGRANQAFKLAAWSLHSNKSHLGALYRRLSVRKHSEVAVQAVARKLAVIFYNMVKHKTAYRPESAQNYDSKRQERERKILENKAKKLGYVLQKQVA